MADRPSTRIQVGSIVEHDMPIAESTISDIVARMDESGLCSANIKALTHKSDQIAYTALRKEIARALSLASSMTCLDDSSFSAPGANSVANSVISMMQGIYSLSSLLQEGANVPVALHTLREAKKYNSVSSQIDAVLNNMDGMKELWVRNGISSDDAETMLGSEIAAMGMAINARENDLKLSAEMRVKKLGRRGGGQSHGS